MGTATRERVAAHDVRLARERPAGYADPAGGTIQAFVSLARGVLAGLLVFFGGVHLIGKSDVISPSSSGLGQLHEIVHHLSIDGLMGPIEIAVGLLLFLTVRHAATRMVGLLLVVAIVVGYANDYSAIDMLNALASFLQGAVESIKVAETA